MRFSDQNARTLNDDKTKKTQGPAQQRSMCLVVQSEVLMREMFNCSHLKSQRDVFGSPSNGRSGRASAMFATSALQCLIRLLCFLLKKISTILSMAAKLLRS